jgi:acid phosphatase
VENIGHQLIASGRSFASYCENLPYDGYSGCATGTYVKKHNAAVYWQGTGVNQIPSTTNLTFNAFPDSTSYAWLPTLSFVIPDKINDMHDGTVEIGDAWLQNNLGSYVEWAQTNNSLFI